MIHDMIKTRKQLIQGINEWEIDQSTGEFSTSTLWTKDEVEGLVDPFLTFVGCRWASASSMGEHELYICLPPKYRCIELLLWEIIQDIRPKLSPELWSDRECLGCTAIRCKDRRD
mgnify:CR=1 FL=1